MPRAPREDFKDAWHHVMNRGARREAVLEPDEHAGIFLQAVGETALRHSIEVHAYAVMPNHYHLLVRSVRGNISRAMQFLGARLTQDLNRLKGWDGPVFRGRFRNQVLRDEAAVLTVIGYIHLNPIRAGIVRRLDQHCWTSHRAYLGLEVPQEWLSKDLLLEHVGGPEAFGEMVHDLRRKREGWPAGFDEDNGWFRNDERVRPWSFRRLRIKDRTVASSAAKPRDILARVAQLTKCSIARLRRAQRGRNGNAARRFAVWVLAQDTDLTHTDIGKLVGMSSEQVGVTLSRMRSAMSGDIGAWTEVWLGKSNQLRVKGRATR